MRALHQARSKVTDSAAMIATKTGSSQQRTTGHATCFAFYNSGPGSDPGAYRSRQPGDRPSDAIADRG